MSCIPDSSSLIILAKLEQIGLLSMLYNNVIITPQVWDEVIEKGKQDRATEVIYLEKYLTEPAFTKVDLADDEKLLAQYLRKQGSGPGESEVLAVACKRQALAILDDKAARASAIGLEIQLTGSIGVIYESFLRKLIDYNTLIGHLERFNKVAWISPGLLMNIIRRAGEGRT